MTGRIRRLLLMQGFCQRDVDSVPGIGKLARWTPLSCAAFGTAGLAAGGTLLPFGIETFEPIEPPWQAIKEWIPDDKPNLNWFNQPRKPSEHDPDWYDRSPAWKAPEIPLDDGRIPVLEYT